MNKRFLGVLIFAFVVASAASLLLYRVLNRPSPSKAAVATTQIVQAAHDLEMGSVIHDDDVKLADWSGNVPAGATAHKEDVLKRGVLTPIYAREPIIESRLAPLGAGGGLAAMIPRGMRAVAVRVNEVVGVAGFVIPGMHVDVLISGTSPYADQRLGTQTRTMLQDIEVLSAGQDFKKDNEGKPLPVQVVNLLVNPEQAEQLSLASSQTQIQLVLRNPLDKDPAKTPGTAVARLFGTALRMPAGDLPGRGGDVSPAPRPVAPRRAQQAGEASAPPRKPAAFTMEIISGNTKKDVKFENGGEANK
ncbi:MAG: Flp pilus assembly protein CpaB [Bryobacteraceae bacterium]|jgi:pilus assembly protein CpaB